MKELVVISGKGGTGKTSITASFAVLAERAVMADCDVDASDLPLLFSPQTQQREVFVSGHDARISPELCNACGTCERLCRFQAIQRHARPDGTITYSIDPSACEGCGVCARYCPRRAIDLRERICGEWFVSDTRCGPMVHASLSAAAENSGKLVSVVRDQARKLALRLQRKLVLIDGAPGIGCPVIASITGASLAMIVTEPTVSGIHDLERVVGVTDHFHVPTWICINKWDINPDATERIEAFAHARRLPLAGRVRYDPAVTQAQIEARTLVEHSTDGAARDVRRVWAALRRHVQTPGSQLADTGDASLRIVPPTQTHSRSHL